MNNGSFLKLFWYLNSASFIVGQSSQRYYCAVTIGDDAVISAFRLVSLNKNGLCFPFFLSIGFLLIICLIMLKTF